MNILIEKPVSSVTTMGEHHTLYVLGRRCPGGAFVAAGEVPDGSRAFSGLGGRLAVEQVERAGCNGRMCVCVLGVL